MHQIMLFGLTFQRSYLIQERSSPFQSATNVPSYLFYFFLQCYFKFNYYEILKSRIMVYKCDIDHA